MEIMKKTNVDKSTGILSKFGQVKVGPIPLPLYIVLACLVFGAAYLKKLPADLIGGFAAIMVMGFFLGEVGGRIPGIRAIGGPAIFAIFVPSAMLYYKLLHPQVIAAITATIKTSNLLYIYISLLVAGSILGMNRKVLIQGFVKMFIPLVIGTIAAVICGVGAGVLFGRSVYETFFYIVIPIVGGGIGEGILPLSIAYSEILGKSQSVFVAQLVPAALLGNLVAIFCSGMLKRLGEKRPEFSGNGVLVKVGNIDEIMKEKEAEKPIDFRLMWGGLLIACSFFIFGNILSKFISIPGPIIMIFTAAIVKALNLMPEKIEQGAYHMYKFIATITFCMLAGVGVLYVPWQDLIRAFTFEYFVICAATVFGMVSSGFFIGKFINMHPVESAIVTACHSGLGGAGDVAILSASNRMELMPFAQISTRIGGALMIVLASILMKMVS